MNLTFFSFVKAQLRHEDEKSLASINLWTKLPGDIVGPSGALVAFMLYVRRLLAVVKAVVAEKWRLQSIEVTSVPVDVLIYAQTQNQFDSICGIANELDRMGRSVRIVMSEHLSKKDVSDRVQVCYDRVLKGESLFVLCCLIMRIWHVLKIISNNQVVPRGALHGLNQCCLCYRSLYRVNQYLRWCSPRFVLVSNDHCAGPRSMRLAAEANDVPCGYVQHACVTLAFPILAFDYAFLDGYVAAETYASSSYGSENTYLRTRSRGVQIYLTGQQKLLGQRAKAICRDDGTELVVGMAVNMLTFSSQLEQYVKRFLGLGCKVIVRLHPRSTSEALEQYSRIFDCEADVEVIHATSETLASFFSRVDCLLAGNSSVLLEAAIFGLPSFACTLSGAMDSRHDVYRFEEFRLVSDLELEDVDRAFVEKLSDGELIADPATIRRFSATYGTVYQGRENSLVATLISGLLHQETKDSCELWHRSTIGRHHVNVLLNPNLI